MKTDPEIEIYTKKQSGKVPYLEKNNDHKWLGLSQAMVGNGLLEIQWKPYKSNFDTM